MEESLEKMRTIQNLRDMRLKFMEDNRKMNERWEKLKEKIKSDREERKREEEETIQRVTAKLQVDWDEKLFQRRVFEELEKAGFKRLSFLNDILQEWDLSHLTGYPALLAQAGLSLDRKTDEIQFYRDLFAQLDREKLIHFLAWAVEGEELDESVIEEIVPPFTDDDIREIVESWGAKITKNVNECPKCHTQRGIPQGYRRACMKCAKWSIQTGERIHIPSMWEETDGDVTYLCPCRSRDYGYHIVYGKQPAYDHKCMFHK